MDVTVRQAGTAKWRQVQISHPGTRYEEFKAWEEWLWTKWFGEKMKSVRRRQARRNEKNMARDIQAGATPPRIPATTVSPSSLRVSNLSINSSVSEDNGTAVTFRGLSSPAINPNSGKRRRTVGSMEDMFLNHTAELMRAGHITPDRMIELALDIKAEQERNLDTVGNIEAAGMNLSVHSSPTNRRSRPLESRWVSAISASSEPGDASPGSSVSSDEIPLSKQGNRGPMEEIEVASPIPDARKSIHRSMKDPGHGPKSISSERTLSQTRRGTIHHKSRRVVRSSMDGDNLLDQDANENPVRTTRPSRRLASVDEPIEEIEAARPAPHDRKSTSPKSSQHKLQRVFHTSTETSVDGGNNLPHTAKATRPLRRLPSDESADGGDGQCGRQNDEPLVKPGGSRAGVCASENEDDEDYDYNVSVEEDDEGSDYEDDASVEEDDEGSDYEDDASVEEQRAERENEGDEWLEWHESDEDENEGSDEPPSRKAPPPSRRKSMTDVFWDDDIDLDDFHAKSTERPKAPLELGDISSDPIPDSGVELLFPEDDNAPQSPMLEAEDLPIQPNQWRLRMFSDEDMRAKLYLLIMWLLMI